MAEHLIVPENITDATGQWTPAQEVGIDAMASLEWRKLLKEVDPRLDLIYAKPNAVAFPIPDRWYIIRRNEAAPVAFWVVQDENGTYCPFSQAHFDRFRQGDTATNPDLWKKMAGAAMARKERAQRAMDEKRAEFRERLLERLDHNHETTVAITPAMAMKLRSPDA